MSDEYSIRTDAGTISVTPSALCELVVHAVEGVAGLRVRRPRRGLDVDVSNGAARVEIELAARYGLVLPELAREAQERIAAAIETMCGLEVGAVDVTIEELDR
jgi:uncharacterized alkaline shock family protein YloU